MPVPPPPPPAPPPPPPPAPLQSQAEPPKIAHSKGGGRNALLADIQRGTRLKNVTQVNDRSAPVIDKPRVNPADGSDNAKASGGSGVQPALRPSLSGLFAGGFPVLKPVGQREKTLPSRPVTRSGSTASLKQPVWNLPSQEENFRASTPNLSASHRTLERTSSLNKTRPVSSYTAPPSPSQLTPPNSKLLTSPPTLTPPPLPPPLHLHPERASNKPPPLPTCLPPPPPPHITKPTWLPVQSNSIPAPTSPPPPPPPPSTLSSALPERSSGFFFLPPPSPILADTRFCNIRDSPPLPPPPLPAYFPPSLPSSLPPPPPPPPKVPAYRPAVPQLPPSYPCTAPCRRPPAVPRSAGAGRLAPPPTPPARSSTTELSSRIPPPPPPLPPAPPNTVRNGDLHIFDDFESKFQFHPVEDFPPPEEFRPFPRIYPSKENQVSLQPPGLRTYPR
ncbi:WAS/WASL-interacting protein family member 3 [Trichomycterus rosablanca]|uniref:WAS/WASL-interacting protein family member 3 n=1 Tax=Trichomycterus rosablanca TaxID=2290929 RepID=UPI002F3561B9